jgi:S1-C subfamily serine protease
LNWLDICIIILCLVAIFRGKDIGLVQQVFSTIGFFGGLFIGALLEPHTVSLAHTALSRSLITIATTLGCAMLLLAFGEYLGSLAKRRIQKWSIDELDRFLGGALSVATILVAIWLSSAIIGSLQSSGLQTTIKNSAIVGKLTRTLPSAPNVISDLGHLIDPNGFPQVFANGEPAPRGSTKLPSLGKFQGAVHSDQISVVKIEGIGCGGIVEGSGFIVADGTIITNAHVVAGVKKPTVSDTNGQHSAKVIWFDPNLDLAVLKVDDLAGFPLVLNTDSLKQNTPGVVLGYPGGGAFNAQPAVVIDTFTAIGRNIYNSGRTERDVYEIGAHIIPGNSGGPLITADGRVAGIVFAESTTYNSVGYALSLSQIIPDLSQAQAQNRVVSTGKCAD